MALETDALKNGIKSLLSSMRSSSEKEENAGSVADNFASELASMIETYVKSGEVVVTVKSGEIAVQGSATSQANVSVLTLKGVVK